MEAIKDLAEAENQQFGKVKSGSSGLNRQPTSSLSFWKEVRLSII
jgi:hypothetical protein